MRSEGTIIEMTTSKGGFGKIKESSSQLVHFERVECNYPHVRLGDVVTYELEEIQSGTLEAMNIDFLRHPVLSELDTAYQKQSEITGEAIKNVEHGLLIEYKGITILLPNSEIDERIITLGSEIKLFVKKFAYHANIIGSLTKSDNSKVVEKYGNYIGTANSFAFQVLEANEAGARLTDGEVQGFLPRSHYGADKDLLPSEGAHVTVAVISCSIKSGLILSVRNHLFYQVLYELENAYKNRISMNGRIVRQNRDCVFIDYKGVELDLRRDYLINKEQILKNDDYVDFKLITFSFVKKISISEIETSSKAIFEIWKNQNLFKGKVIKEVGAGLVVSLNDTYYGFVHFREITDNWRMEESSLQPGAVINVSIQSFDQDGLLLSRKLYKRKIRKQGTLKNLKLNSVIELEIDEKMSFSGLILSNGLLKGNLSLDSIIPVSILNQIDRREFIQYSRLVFKKRSILKCIVKDKNLKDGRAVLDLDYSDVENKKRIEEVLAYFSQDESSRQTVIQFYNNKVQ
tara:strand:+ start:1425 stop:2972 length:1548 start_codon:yes stop_codon:yes gene_type:complete